MRLQYHIIDDGATRRFGVEENKISVNFRWENARLEKVDEIAEKETASEIGMKRRGRSERTSSNFILHQKEYLLGIHFILDVAQMGFAKNHFEIVINNWRHV